MASAAAALPPKPSNIALKSRKRRWTREQLLHNLTIIGDLGAPLPPTLPPSPPTSRAASPVVGLKRKLDPASDLDPVKRPKITSAALDRSQSLRHPPQSSPLPPPPQPPSIQLRQPAPAPAQSSVRSEPSEDGEVREDLPLSSLSLPPAATDFVPQRRPKKGKLPQSHFDFLHDTYHQAGRVLKYSGDARYWSTYPPSHREYRPLSHPPPPNSVYHNNGAIIAKLELVDALICFAYSIWNKEYPRRICAIDTWATIEAFLTWCKAKWSEGTSDAEKAFLGLIWMLDAFIQGRKMRQLVRGPMLGDMDKAHQNIAKKVSAAADSAMEGDPVLAASFGFPNGKAPPMLPSPSSANSTPVNRDGSTPSNNSTQRQGPIAASRLQEYKGPVPFKYLPTYMQNTTAPIPPHVMTSMNNCTEGLGPALVHNLKDLVGTYASTVHYIGMSQTTLNLPILNRCFPKTWRRIIHTNLLPTEEHEPDIEDEEGELYWPDNCVNGEGIGWVCLLGKAMIQEFGKTVGYMGMDGVVPKPKPLEEAQGKGPPPSVHQSQRHSSSTVVGSSYRPSVPTGAPR